jgi:isoamylase
MSITNFTTSPGSPLPLGPSLHEDGVNFAIHASLDTTLSLCIFQGDNPQLIQEIPLDPLLNRTGLVWHLFVYHLPQDCLYAFRSKDSHIPLLLDPYAKALHSSHQWGEEKPYQPLSAIVSEEFDWQGVVTPAIPCEDLIIYEMHVRGFTQHPSSKAKAPGKFLGVIEKIPYLKSLGVNAVELMPIHEFNEKENRHVNPFTGERLYNFWGYSPVHYFAPMNRYATDNAYIEFKTLVRELHRAGIEVILDVVFNHTAEGDQRTGPTYSFRGLDDKSYYIHDHQGAYLDFTGCGNSFNANHPIGRELIIDCLRHWAVDMHVDGFRFDLASALMRDQHGIYRENAPLIEEITQDPILANCKMIAEPWDVRGLYQVGNFYPQIGRWVEWNGKYRDCVRRFINGNKDYLSRFTTRLCGSQDLYGKTRKPYNSLNLIVAHDGFSLSDLVTYNQKHNLPNGENNHDGLNQNDSWNCGFEGKTTDADIIAVRNRQLRNFFLAQMVSQGIPMILMGDEYGHSKQGNNNSWCQDNEINWFLWDHVEGEKADSGFSRFYRKMIQFRRTHPTLRRKDFLTPKEVIWHGVTSEVSPWHGEPNFIAFTIAEDNGEELYIAFNAQENNQLIEIPAPSAGTHWMLAVDTSKESPNDIVDKEAMLPVKSQELTMGGYSAIILVAIS